MESPYPLIAVEDALALIEREVSRLSAIPRPFDEALGFVLAEEVIAAEPMPPFVAAAVDGFAVIAADGPGLRQIVGEQMAGPIADVQVTPGSAARVTTGAPIPPGADAMVMVEETEEQAGQVNILAPKIEVGANIRPVGQEIAAGQQILAPGTLLGPAELGLLATVGQTTVHVYRRPRVAVLSTGTEIVPPHETPEPGQIRDANRYTLIGAVRQTGAEPLDLGIAPDTPEGTGKPAKLQTLIERGLAEADVLLTSGGVSMGQLDLVKPYLAARGTLHFGRINAKPGKPLTFVTVEGKPCFALPGFPVSALVSFEIFVRPALLKMAGHTPIHRPREQALLTHPVRHSPDRTEFQRVLLTRRADGRLTATTTGIQWSSRLLSMHGANGLIILPHGQGNFDAGAVVEAVVIGTIQADMVY
jgi:molybdenum cofactor synthesis domain-containing protein